MKLNFDKVMKHFPMKKPRDIQVEAIRKTIEAYNNGAEYVVLEAPTGCHRIGTPILMADGTTVAVEDIVVGDEVRGWGGPQKVLCLALGREQMVEVRPVKGEPFVVNLSHVLTLVHTEENTVVDVTVRDWLEWSNYKKHCYKLFRVPVKEFKAWGLGGPENIPPYVLGVLLGAGSLAERSPRVHKPDPELGPDLQAFATSWDMVYRFNPERGEHYIHGRKRGPAAGGPNRLTQALRALELNVHSGQRFIPPHYLTADWTSRLELLAGLMDTDGHMSNGGFDFISQSKDLAEGVVFLARSVGLAAYLKPAEKYDQNGMGGLYWRVSISGDCDLIPCRIPRKRAPKRQQVKDVLRTGFTVELLEEEDYYGFSLDGDGRYLLGDFTVTHNSGKSPLAMTFAEAFGRSFVLTLTSQLQDQYLRDFRHLGLEVLKGRGKFRCHTLGGNATCQDGKVMKVTKTCGGNCPYVLAKNRALAAKHCIANYHSFFWNVGRGESKQMGLLYAEEDDDQRDLVVLDEVHATEGFLLEQMGVTVHLSKLSVKTTAPPDNEYDTDAYCEYIEKELLPTLRDAEKRTPDEEAKEEFRLLIGKLSFVLATRDDDWVPERGRMKDGNLDKTWFALKPLYVRRYGHRLWGGASRQLLLSGTVLSAFQVVHNIGLDPEKGDHIELDSPFPATNRPIFVGNLDMTKKARDTSWPMMVEMVDSILTAHPREKGILLTPSNEMLKYIHKGLSRINAARFVFAYGDDREVKYREHMAGTRPSVLAASGYWEGADLRGDASRFQIIPAAPRPMWQGQVAARAKKDANWYRWMTWTKFLQGTGRSIRDEKDTAATYVLDRELRAELKRSDTMIPKWVQKAIELVD